MPIADVNIDSFEVLMEGSLSQIKTISFSKNNELGRTAQLLASCIDPVMLDDGQLQSGLNDVCNDPTYQEMFSDLDNVTVSITEKMLEFRSILYDKIHPEAETLYNEIQLEKNKILQLEGVEDFLENKPELYDHFKIVNWISPMLVRMDKRTLKEHVHDFLGDGSPRASLNTLRYGVKKVYFEAEDVPVNSEVYDDTVETVTGEVCEEGCDCAAELVKALFKKDNCQQLQQRYIQRWKNSNIVESSLYFNNNVSLLNNVIEIVRKLNLDINKKAQDALNSNINKLEKYVYCNLYYLSVVREVELDQKLILTQTELNEDAYKNFLKEGYTLEDVYKFLHMNYRDRIIPHQGIRSTNVVELMDMTNSKYSKWRTNSKNSAAIITKNANMKAFSRVLRKYLEKFRAEDVPYSLNAFLNDQVHYIQRTSMNVANDRSNVTDGIYDFLANCNYHNTDIPKLVKNFREELINTADTYSELAEEHVDTALCSVMVDYILDTLTPKLEIRS